MDEFDDFWSSVGLKDDGLPSDEEVLEQERADARRDREWILEQFDQYRALTDKLVQIVTDSPLDETQKVDLLSALTKVRCRLMQEPVRLLVLGASSAGKSTLVNALTGRIVSPEAQHSSTLIPAWIHAVDSELGGEVDYHVLKQDLTQHYMARPAYLKDFCHPPEDKNTNPDDYAVIAEVEGGFLADSGLMLLDTPGVDQTDADTNMTVRTADLGAEMVLMIIRSNVFSQQETALFKKLFTGGELDLGLDMQSDVFSVYNVMPGNPDPPSNVVDSIREMTDGKLDTNERLYSIDMLQERQRFEPYCYYDWAPMKIRSKEETLKLKEDQHREKHGYTVGARQRPYGYDLLKGTPPGPEMKRLTDALRRRAWTLYAKKERTCTPVLSALSDILGQIKQALTSQLDEIRQNAEEDARKIDGTELISYSPEFSERLGKLNAFDQKSEEIGQQQQKLLADVDNVKSRLGEAADYLKTVAVTKFAPASELFKNVDTSMSALRKDAQGMVDRLRLRVRFLSQHWQGKLTGESFLLDDSKAIRRIDIQDILANLGNDYNHLAGRVNELIGGGSIRKLEPEKAANRLMKKYDRDVSKDLTNNVDIEEATRGIGRHPLLADERAPGEDAVPVVMDDGPGRPLASRAEAKIFNRALLAAINVQTKGALSQLETKDLIAFTDGIRAFADTVERSGYIAAIRDAPFKETLDEYREKLEEKAVQAAAEAYDAIAEQLFQERSGPQQTSLCDLAKVFDAVVELLVTLAEENPEEEAEALSKA